MNVHAPNFDIEKFRKVHTLISGGATAGERAAAKARAEAIAAKAGLTLQQAVSKIGSATKPKPANFFEGFDDWMEEKEPGYKDRRAREAAEREARYAARRAEILNEFGTLRAFFDPTEWESLLLKAGDPFVTKRGYYTDVCGTRRRYAKEFAGISGSIITNLKPVAPAAITAIKEAYPFPETVGEAFEELKVWDKLNDGRAHFFDHHEYYFDMPVELRVELLRNVMRKQPVTSWADLEARFHYKSYAWQQQWIDERDFEDAEWSRLFADFRILRTMAATSPTKSGQSEPDAAPHGAQSGRRTNAEKKSAVLSMLDSHPELSDREIGRRVGVSGQTVSNWRRRTAA